MSPSVSVAEKTLEHWASQYVMYRYRSKAALWWPTRGEDIDVRSLPVRPGKAIQLELKTTTVAGVDLHDVVIDLGQLWEYRLRPFGRQPFYAFPWPGWRGYLADAASADGRAVTELAFRRSGAGWWFADWMVLLTAAQVAAVLRIELAAHGSSIRGKKTRLVRFDLTDPVNEAVRTWGSGVAEPDVIDWREFWTDLETCGRADWPQLIRLPTRLARHKVHFTHARVATLLQRAKNLPNSASRSAGEEELVTLEPDMDGAYRVTSGPVDDEAAAYETRSDTTGLYEDDFQDFRQVVFLAADALRIGSATARVGPHSVTCAGRPARWRRRVFSFDVYRAGGQNPTA